mmetsp:Transcript_13691/g.39435  ORF Transcript_13691/g.39435 Transcript_13691/m.39435 type:complete len:400 (-) Transcript_13691:22-1221(-)
MNDDGGAEMRGQLLVTLETSVAHSQRLVWGVAAPDLLPRVAVDGHEEPLHIRRAPEVNKGEAGTNVAVLLARHVEEGVPLGQSTHLQEVQEVLTSTVAEQVPHHNRRALVLAAQDLVHMDVELREVLVRDLAAQQLPVGGVSSRRRGAGTRLLGTAVLRAGPKRSPQRNTGRRRRRRLGRRRPLSLRNGWRLGIDCRRHRVSRGCAHGREGQRRGSGVRGGSRNSAGRRAARCGQKPLGGAQVVELHEKLILRGQNVRHIPKLSKAANDANLGCSRAHAQLHTTKVVFRGRERHGHAARLRDGQLCGSHIEVRHEQALQHCSHARVHPCDFTEGGILLDELRRHDIGLFAPRRDADRVGQSRRHAHCLGRREISKTGGLLSAAAAERGGCSAAKVPEAV